MSGFSDMGDHEPQVSVCPGPKPAAGSYNADDQLSSETYDANGNITLAANGNIYTYDSENHMTSATGNGKTITMVYEGVPIDWSLSTDWDAFGNLC